MKKMKKMKKKIITSFWAHLLLMAPTIIFRPLDNLNLATRFYPSITFFPKKNIFADPQNSGFGKFEPGCCLGFAKHPAAFPCKPSRKIIKRTEGLSGGKSSTVPRGRSLFDESFVQFQKCTACDCKLWWGPRKSKIQQESGVGMVVNLKVGAENRPNTPIRICKTQLLSNEELYNTTQLSHDFSICGSKKT